MTPAISVVVSTHNRATLVAQALDRLAAQATTVPYEVIAVDNNSSDETSRVIAAAAARHPGLIRGGFEARQGVSHGRNSGISMSLGSIIAFTDDDVLVTDDWVERIARAFEDHPDVDCVGGRVLPVWETPPPAWVTPRHWSPLALVDYGDQPFLVDRARRVCLVTANVAYRRTALDAIGWFSTDFPRCQDHELLLRLWRSERSGLYLPDLVVMCKVPESRLTWDYHRAWHSEHGRFCARMGDDQAGPHSGADGETGPTLFGATAVLYRDLALNAGRFAFARVLGRKERARDAEAALRHRAAFIRTRVASWRLQDRGGALREIRRFLSQWLRTAPEGPAPSVSKRGRAQAYLLIAVLVGGSTYDIVRDEEHWPFSQYPMFSIVEESREFTSLRLYGVTAGQKEEIPLLDAALLDPLDQCRLSTALSWMSRTPDAEERFADVLRTTYDRYERRRWSGEHDGPELEAVRLYRSQWTLRADASNRDRPDSRELVMAFNPVPIAAVVR